MLPRKCPLNQTSSAQPTLRVCNWLKLQWRDARLKEKERNGYCLSLARPSISSATAGGGFIGKKFFKEIRARRKQQRHRRVGHLRRFSGRRKQSARGALHQRTL